MNTKTDPKYSPTAIQRMAQDFLLRLKMGEVVGDDLQQFDAIPLDALLQATSNDAARKAFWINVYNAFNLYLMKNDPASHGGYWGKLRHFMRRSIRIAGLRLSLMNIENKILRRGKHWWGFGLTRNPFPSRTIRALQVETLDPRIHFALNCGARSCPPIRFYVADEIDAQLDLATTGYLQNEVHYDPDQPDEIRVAGIFRLYFGDFGGMAYVVKWIRRYRPDIPNEMLRVVWEKYDNSLHLDAFAE